jgi:hypothetical protein
VDKVPGNKIPRKAESVYSAQSTPLNITWIGKELHVAFDPFPGQDELQPLLDKLNDKRVALPWLNHLIVQLSIAHDKPVYPLTEPEKRNRLFGDG